VCPEEIVEVGSEGLPEEHDGIIFGLMIERAVDGEDAAAGSDRLRAWKPGGRRW
jgi:hypothetical protein